MGPVEKASKARTAKRSVVPVGERLPKSDRVLRRGEFLRVQNRGRKLHTVGFLVFALPAPHGRTRVGVTASKKVGTAVQRNRVKRLVREVFRRNRAVLPPERLDVVFVAKQRAVSLTYLEVLEQFQAACRMLARPGHGRGRGPARTAGDR